MQSAALIDSARANGANASQWRSRPEGNAMRVTVAVGHSSTLVAAGLAATLGRVPGCDVRMWPMSPAATDSAPRSAPSAQLVFGDSALLKSLQEMAKSRLAQPSLANAKFVLMTVGDDHTAQAFKANGEIDECLSIECEEEELFATVHRLADSPPSGSHPRAEGHAAAFAAPGNAPRQPVRNLVRGGLAPGALRRVREYIDQNLTGKLLADKLAAVAKLSPGHFSRAFRQSTGKSPHQYITHRRVALAAELLERTSRALADIALEVGFADQSHFSRTFALVAGETPSACRRRHR
jgi:AraC-like DNA-binding protein